MGAGVQPSFPITHITEYLIVETSKWFSASPLKQTDMASMTLEGDVRKSLLDRTDAEKVFRPWWDTVEDMLLNSLIALGNIFFFLYFKENQFDTWFNGGFKSTGEAVPISERMLPFCLDYESPLGI